MRITHLLLALGLLFGVAAQATTIEMKVNGLVCGFCANGIDKTLRKNPATADVLVSLEQRLVAVKTRDGADIPDAELRKALTDAGYEVKSIQRTDRTMDELRASIGKDSK